MITNKNADPERDPAEMIEASEHVSSGDMPPEIVPGVEELTEWDTPVGAAGESAPRVLPEDDVPPGELLVQEGIEEADREQRIAAADPDLMD
jgi:hypothetical protein